MFQDDTGRDSVLRLKGQQGGYDILCKVREVVWRVVIARADHGEQRLGVGVKERVMSNQQGVQDHSETPQISSFAGVASWLQHFGADISWAAMPLSQLAFFQELCVLKVLELKS